MKLITTVVLMLAGGLVIASEKQEPSLGYTLRLGKETVRLVPGQETQLKGVFENPKATLIPDKERLFTYAGLTFKYPSNFAFEADFKTDGVKIWSLDGSDFIIMVQQYDAVVTPKTLSEQLKKMYGPATKTESTSYKFNGTELSGVRVVATIAETKLTQDVLAVPTKKGSRVLILQDAKEKVSDDESKFVLKLLNESFKF
jgi:hypothetical protein